MPWVLLFIGLVAITAGVRGQAANASQLLASEFTGPNSFVQWFLAIMILGLIGYYRPARALSDAMLGLVIVALILKKGNPNGAGGGFFAQLENAFKTATATQSTSPGSTASGSIAATSPTGESVLNTPSPVQSTNIFDPWASSFPQSGSLQNWFNGGIGGGGLQLSPLGSTGYMVPVY